MIAALLAVAVVLFGHLMGWHGVDTAAQVFRVNSFRDHGFSLWDYSWYGGHWTLDYSVLYPALAGTLGILLMTALSAGAASFAFDRLVRSCLPWPGAVLATYSFAAGTLVAASIGQLTFLAGEAFGIPALLAAARGRRSLALLLALACTLTSPLTGAFLALAAAAWGLTGLLDGQRERVRLCAGMVAVAGVPIALAAVLFPGDGPMPYPIVDWAWEMVVAAVIAAMAGRRYRTISAAAALWMLAASFSELVPSALGGNIGRLEDMVALPIGLALTWERLPVLAPVTAVPLLLSQWVPALDAFTATAQPSTKASYFAPLDQSLQLLSMGGPAGRVEVIPTEFHWEAAYVADIVPLARGWERQLDEADNPIFYQPGDLVAATYRDWLVNSGVRFVALPSAPLDTAGKQEAAIVSSGAVPGLDLVWQSADWKVYEVEGSPGIVSGPARLVSESDGAVVLDARSAGTLTVRIRWSPDWYVVGGAGCLQKANVWLAVNVTGPGPVDLQMSLLQPNRTPCTAGATAVSTVAAGPSGGPGRPGSSRSPDRRPGPDLRS
jgi:hypothetical protein